MPPNLELVTPSGNNEQEKRDQHIENMLYAARDLRELYEQVTYLAGYEDTANASATSIRDISHFFAGELAKIGSVIDGVNGHAQLTSDPQNLAEVMAQFPVTPLGTLSEKYGLQERVLELLTKLQIEQSGVDVKLP